MRRMIGFKSAGQSDAGFLRRRATSGLDSLVCASASHCMHGAFESEPLHCIRALPQKSTGNLDVARDLHKEDGARRAARTNVSRETFRRIAGVQIPGGRIPGWPSNGKFFRDCGELRGNAARQNIATWCFARRSVPLRRNREEHAAETPQSRKNLPHTGKALRREGGGAELGMGTRLRHAARGAAARRAPCRGGPTLRPARGPAGSRR